MTEPDDSDRHAALTAPDAGQRAIRGGIIRVAGYGAALVLTAVASVFLLRHLGVVRFGQYTTVIAIVTVVQGLTDAGLTVVGQRLYVHADAARRRTLLADLVGIRLVLTPLGVLVGVLFAVVAGYPHALVTGTVLAGLGIVLATVAMTLVMPLSVDLRFGAVTAVDFVRQLVIVAGIVALVVAGSGLVPFFAVYAVAGAAAVGMALALVGIGSWVAPRFAWSEWKPLLREAAPVALSSVVNTTYVRALIIICSLLATAEQTGLFATSYRVSEILLGVPQMMLGAAFPILAHAHVADQERLRYALQRMGEAALLLGLGLALVLAVGAEPIVLLLGGDRFAAAADPLRIQSVAIAGAFMTQVGTFALIAVQQQRALVAVNVFALVTVLALGCTLIPLWEANGAALAASVGEVSLAIAALAMLTRVRPELRPDLRYVPKLLLAAALGALCVLLPIPDAVAAVAAVLVYGGVALVLRAVPLELFEALLKRKAALAE
ncbi:oligosaccharide flippase family protein [Conexibacter woesei]|uniref:Polysaccharide biosynthesis protein n=1 Tax=Conexibacter woesei (strain DSM 14684 / CCUG 47730 / CIP 108061 / JCM 11494 / NBRC 100937 / ID131577) TaxID=469383 RepID=D3EZS0_CONWI|nr:oligosaccharide flippase family protein [Conexibacter woesei]ADB53908.1 polysaccharide biosynthesis protein [Conexibacter woesei DSM 14684]